MAGPPEAIVVGAGPNGLAAAVTLARAGRAVRLVEAGATVGGGMRTAHLTLPGFRHDICSAIHPMAAGSPFFAGLPLAEHGLAWIHPVAPLAHPLDGGTAAMLERSFEGTGATLGPDAGAWRALMEPLVRAWPGLVGDLLAPLHLPRHPVALAGFGLQALRSARGLAEARFGGEPARALFAGIAAHSLLPLEAPLSAAVGLVLGAAGHAVGWPLPRGGSQSIADALASLLRSLGGEIVTGAPVTTLEDLPTARAVLLNVTPRQLLRLGGHRLPPGYRRSLARYRYGAGVFKIDLALDGPIPWAAAACARAGTVHLGGTLGEITAAEAAVTRGEHPERPFVLLAQQSLFDDSRAPAGKHTVWAYCHVPHGSTVDMAERIERQIERFAPGFRERILARHVLSPAALEAYNANYIGGDINGGVQDLRQLFTRPTARLVPYATPARGLYSAPHPRRPAGESTACAATTLPASRCAGSGDTLRSGLPPPRAAACSARW